MAGFLTMGCSKKDTTKNPSDVWSYKSIQVDFGTGDWHLFLGAKGEVGLPIKAFLHLYAMKGSELVEISEPRQMNKLNDLSVRTPEAALNFVRLFTQPDTFMIFNGPNAIEKNPNETQVTRIDDFFVVVRCLLIADEVEPKGYPLIRVKEQVSFNGKYTIVQKEVLKYVSSDEAHFSILE
jgi:hypothetical protein